MEVAKDQDDPELAALIGELSIQHPDFRTWWATHQVTAASYGTKDYHHPLVGNLTLDCTPTTPLDDGSVASSPGTPADQ